MNLMGPAAQDPEHVHRVIRADGLAQLDVTQGHGGVRSQDQGRSGVRGQTVGDGVGFGLGQPFHHLRRGLVGQSALVQIRRADLEIQPQGAQKFLAAGALGGQDQGRGDRVVL